MDTLEKLSQFIFLLDRGNWRTDYEKRVWPADLVTRGDQICGTVSSRLNNTAKK